MKEKSIKKSSSLSFVKNDGLFFDVNFFQYYPQNVHKNSKPSSFLLAKAFENKLLDQDIVKRVEEIQQVQGVNKTLWGLRFERSKFSLEFYFFYPKKFKKNDLQGLKKILNPYLKYPIVDHQLKDNCYLISYNLNTKFIEHLNVYYPRIDSSKPTITVDDTGFTFNKENPVFNSFSYTTKDSKYKKTNTYYTFFELNQLHEILKRTYSCCKIMFPKEDPIFSNKYLEFPYLYEGSKLTHVSAVTLKKDAIGLYFLHLSVDRFIQFLKFHNYPKSYIQSVEKEKHNLNHLFFDIGIDFYLKNGKFVIKKTAFWGTF